MRLRRPGAAGLAHLDGASADGRLGELLARRDFLRPWLGALAAEMVRTRAYEPLGFRSLDDWSRERIGCGARVVREWARVWTALRGLPRLREAVLAGTLSWSVAGRIVALATPENEAACLETVRGRTVRAVETILAALRAGEEGPDARSEEERSTLRLACDRALREKWHAALELARRMAGRALSPGEVAETIAAEGVAAVGVPEAAERDEPRGRRAARADRAPGLAALRWPGLRARRRRDASRLPAPEALDRALAGLGPRSLDGWMQELVAGRQATDFEIGRLLARVVGRRLHRELGFARFDEYVRERLFLAPRTARRWVRLARAEATLPAVASAFREGRLTLLQAEVLLRRRGDETGEGGVATACRTTLRGLEDDAPPPLVFGAPRSVVRLFRALVRQLGLERLLDHALATWLEAGRAGTDPADFARDGWRCTVPACSARANLQSHHVVYRSRGGPDVDWNRTTLCAVHHLRGVHAGRVHIRGRAPDGLVYRLGFGVFASGDRRLTGNVYASAMKRSAGGTIP